MNELNTGTCLVQELRQNGKGDFKNYLRMNTENFEELLCKFIVSNLCNGYLF